ncbi:gamma-aminobutyrate permease, partial [Mammaliicoccus sciuri]
IKFRKEDKSLHEKSKFKNPFGVIGSYLALIFFVFVLVILFFANDTRTALMYSPLWIVLLLVVYYINRRKHSTSNE